MSAYTAHDIPSHIVPHVEKMLVEGNYPSNGYYYSCLDETTGERVYSIGWLSDEETYRRLVDAFAYDADTHLEPIIVADKCDGCDVSGQFDYYPARCVLHAPCLAINVRVCPYRTSAAVAMCYAKFALCRDCFVKTGVVGRTSDHIAAGCDRKTMVDYLRNILAKPLWNMSVEARQEIAHAKAHLVAARQEREAKRRRTEEARMDHKLGRILRGEQGVDLYEDDTDEDIDRWDEVKNEYRSVCIDDKKRQRPDEDDDDSATSSESDDEVMPLDSDKTKRIRVGLKVKFIDKSGNTCWATIIKKNRRYCTLASDENRVVRWPNTEVWSCINKKV